MSRACFSYNVSEVWVEMSEVIAIEHGHIGDALIPDAYDVTKIYLRGGSELIVDNSVSDVLECWEAEDD